MARRKQPLRKVRVREIPLENIDTTKIALAYWLMAKRMLEEEDSAESGQEQEIS
ncbi:MAG: hypothetical protein JSS68_11650 [Actinobacteria bacterium]|nr:hypothetical protein [Actinomycetota bacterium]